MIQNFSNFDKSSCFSFRYWCMCIFLFWIFITFFVSTHKKGICDFLFISATHHVLESTLALSTYSPHIQVSPPITSFFCAAVPVNQGQKVRYLLIRIYHVMYMFLLWNICKTKADWKLQCTLISRRNLKLLNKIFMNTSYRQDYCHFWLVESFDIQRWFSNTMSK